MWEQIAKGNLLTAEKLLNSIKQNDFRDCSKLYYYQVPLHYGSEDMVDKLLARPELVCVVDKNEC